MPMRSASVRDFRRLIERYKRDVDRTLIRENLRRTPEQRLRTLQQMQRFAKEVRRAARRR